MVRLYIEIGNVFVRCAGGISKPMLPLGGTEMYYITVTWRDKTPEGFEGCSTFCEAAANLVSYGSQQCGSYLVWS